MCVELVLSLSLLTQLLILYCAYIKRSNCILYLSCFVYVREQVSALLCFARVLRVDGGGRRSVVRTTVPNKSGDDAVSS